MIEIRHLHLIKEIAESGSMTRASKRLFLTQPSLSHQLKEIESKLGVLLFQRISKKMILTAEGKRVLETAKIILPTLQRVEMDIKKGMGENSGEIKICTQCYTCYHWLPGILQKFQVSYPLVDVDIVTEGMSAPIEFLLDGRIDFAIVNDKKNERGIQFDKLFDDEQVLLVHKDHPLAQKKDVKAKDFLNENFIMYKERFEEGFFADKVLIPAGVMPRKITKMQLTEAKVELVKAGMGVTVLSRWLAKPFVQETNKIKFVRIGKNGFYRPWFIAYRKHKQMPEYVLRFIEFIKKEKLSR